MMPGLQEEHRIADNANAKRAYLESPFHLDNERQYRQWRERKLDGYPEDARDLIVFIDDLTDVSESEKQKVLEIIEKTNMVVYRPGRRSIESREELKELGRRFGLNRINANHFAGDDGVTALRVAEGGTEGEFIPYTDKPISWHTDGYYNPEGDRIRGLLLHCVQPAQAGGLNRVFDPEILYILLRDENPGHLESLMVGDVMSIPAAFVEGKQIRPEARGPVFSVEQDGSLYFRYTARKKYIHWRDDEQTEKAVRKMKSILEGESPYIFQIQLQAGEGLLCNNVLHDRTGFEDGASDKARLLYRARYFDRIKRRS